MIVLIYSWANHPDRQQTNIETRSGRCTKMGPHLCEIDIFSLALSSASSNGPHQCNIYLQWVHSPLRPVKVLLEPHPCLGHKPSPLGFYCSISFILHNLLPRPHPGPSPLWVPAPSAGKISASSVFHFSRGFSYFHGSLPYKTQAPVRLFGNKL